MSQHMIENVWMQWGSATIAGANTFIDQPLSNTSDGLVNYLVFASLLATTGAPAAGSTRISNVTRSTATQFRITVEVAPGIGNSVTFSWLVIRGGL